MSKNRESFWIMSGEMAWGAFVFKFTSGLILFAFAIIALFTVIGMVVGVFANVLTFIASSPYIFYPTMILLGCGLIYIIYRIFKRVKNWITSHIN